MSLGVYQIFKWLHIQCTSNSSMPYWLQS